MEAMLPHHHHCENLRIHLDGVACKSVSTVPMWSCPWTYEIHCRGNIYVRTSHDNRCVQGEDIKHPVCMSTTCSCWQHKLFTVCTVIFVICTVYNRGALRGHSVHLHHHHRRRRHHHHHHHHHHTACSVLGLVTCSVPINCIEVSEGSPLASVPTWLIFHN